MAEEGEQIYRAVTSFVGREKRDVLSQNPRNHALRFIARDSFKIRWLPSFTMYPPMEKSRYRNVDNFRWTWTPRIL